MTRLEFQKCRTEIISRMLDNPDHLGIYPTTECFDALDALYDEISEQPEAKEPNESRWNNVRSEYYSFISKTNSEIPFIEWCVKHFESPRPLSDFEAKPTEKQYTEAFLEYRSKYFKKDNMVYPWISKQGIRYSDEDLHKSFERAMLESPFKPSTH